MPTDRNCLRDQQQIAEHELLTYLRTGPLAPHVRQLHHAEAVSIGASGAQVYQLWGEQQPLGFLKIGPRNKFTTLADDVARLHWLADRLPVPQVLAYAEEESYCYLLTSPIPGTDAATLAEQDGMDMTHLVRLLAFGLRQIHTLPPDHCPFDYRLPREIERVRRRMADGLVDAQNFDSQWQGRSATDLFAELLATMPTHTDLAFTHGDYCLPNILLDGNRIGGFVDLGRAGMGDRYRDLALARRSLIRNCGAAWVPLFFQAYGLPQPDEAKLTFYQLLDEFY
ncbi:MAG: APH(3') family aminoglycoside O-phosphotransferase [Caldilineaceae bacterium]